MAEADRERSTTTLLYKSMRNEEFRQSFQEKAIEFQQIKEQYQQQLRNDQTELKQLQAAEEEANGDMKVLLKIYARQRLLRKEIEEGKKKVKQYDTKNERYKGLEFHFKQKEELFYSLKIDPEKVPNRVDLEHSLITKLKKEKKEKERLIRAKKGMYLDLINNPSGKMEYTKDEVRYNVSQIVEAQKRNEQETKAKLANMRHKLLEKKHMEKKFMSMKNLRRNQANRQEYQGEEPEEIPEEGGYTTGGNLQGSAIGVSKAGTRYGYAPTKEIGPLDNKKTVKPAAVAQPRPAANTQPKSTVDTQPKQLANAQQPPVNNQQNAPPANNNRPPAMTQPVNNTRPFTDEDPEARARTNPREALPSEQTVSQLLLSSLITM